MGPNQCPPSWWSHGVAPLGLLILGFVLRFVYVAKHLRRELPLSKQLPTCRRMLGLLRLGAVLSGVLLVWSVNVRWLACGEPAFQAQSGQVAFLSVAFLAVPAYLLLVAW